MTGIEFLVGEEAFGAFAKRPAPVLLFARSSIFLLTYSQMNKEANTGRVRINPTIPTSTSSSLFTLECSYLRSWTEHFTVADQYGPCEVQRMDGLMCDYLWLSVAYQLGGADFKLIASDRDYCFPAHKWILAARSPVFVALLYVPL